MAKYHVTNWDGENLQTAAQRFGEAEAIEMFCEKWDTDASFATDQVTKIYLYHTLSEAQDHKDTYGGEILEINDEYLDVAIDEIEGYSTVRYEIDKDAIKRI